MPLTTTPDGVDIAWYDFGGDGPPILLCHATGFHAHVWLPVAERLIASGYHCYALDERAHGDSARPPDGNFAWDGFATDALAVRDAAGLQRPFAVGHSAGGALLLLAEQRQPGSWRSLYLFEPVVPPVDPPLGPSPENPLAVGALRRREVFASRDAAYQNYSSKPPFDRLSPEALRAYVDHGFDDLADGTVRLKCRGADEAAVYTFGMAHDAFGRLGEVRCPVTVACGSETDAFGPAEIGAVAERLPHGRAEVLDGLSHFGPLEDPDQVAASIGAAFAGG
ncbi:MAG: hypothetical protein QOG64_2385 [Acidimicrobiaceae bacterium]|nr:hypothetical protein [Acidimicrobiaceae bacterium]